MQRLALFLLISVIVACYDQVPDSKLSIVPFPQKVEILQGTIDLSAGMSIKIQNEELAPLIELISRDFLSISGEDLSDKKNGTNLSLGLNTDLGAEEYKIDIDQDIQISGGSYQAVVMAITTLWQCTDQHLKLPRLNIHDYPKYPYRSVMLDVARAWHAPSTIHKIIDLCRVYKVNYLHLHLTDDSAFSFPSDSYPQLASKGHSYTKQELIELNQYAYERGVILVPEIEMPGHSSKFVSEMPEVFGIADVNKNPYTINIGKESVYEAIDTLLAEVAAVFTHSPYIHIGGDEAFFGGMEDDPDILNYMTKNDLPNMHELFLHFLIRVNDMVKSHGKQTMVWSGFGEDGDLQIPEDIVVILWNHAHHSAHDLNEKKYSIINSSFKPLYVVNNRKWTPQYIYEQWHPSRWESWENVGDYDIGEELPKDNNHVMGATMCAWEQAEINQFPRLRHRVPSMMSHLWSQATASWEDYNLHQQQTDELLQKITQPFDIEFEGLTDPNIGEGNYYEHLYFDEQLAVMARPASANLSLEYTLDARVGQGSWLPLEDTLTLHKNEHLHIRAVDAEGHMVGQEYYQKFYLSPLRLELAGLWKDLPVGSWEKHRFEDSLQIKLHHTYDDAKIRYVLDGGAIDVESTEYVDGDINITETTHFRAQLYDEDDNKIGLPASRSFYKIWNEPSLTTGKPITASNEHITNTTAPLANNGRISLWEMWGDHVSDENWVQVDLESPQEISRLKVYTFWDAYRYYQYRIEGSLDGTNWTQMVDASDNEELATEHGYEHRIDPTNARYLRLNMLYNSANPGLHLVEFSAFAD